MDQEVWRGRGRVLFPFYNHCPQKESSAREHQTLKFNPESPCPAPLIWSVLHRLRSLSELTILTWKKISNKDICDSISLVGPHSSGAPLVFIVMEMMLFANWLLHLPGATFPTISLTRRVSPSIHSFEFRTFYGLPVVSVHMKDLKQHDTARKGQPKYVKVFLNASPN